MVGYACKGIAAGRRGVLGERYGSRWIVLGGGGVWDSTGFDTDEEAREKKKKKEEEEEMRSGVHRVVKCQ